MTWREARKTLKKDSRYDHCKLLERDEKEKYFDEHIEALKKKQKDIFRSLLDSCPSITLTSSWKQIKKSIQDDPKFAKFSSSDRVI